MSVPAGTADGPGPGWPADAHQSVQDRLFDQRVVFLWGPLDATVAGQLAAQLMTLDATGDDPVQLLVDSPGGTLEAALCLVDVIDLLGVELTATCVGRAVGPAIGPLAVAHRRRATPHARFRLSEPVLEISGGARDLGAWAADHRAQLRTFCRRLAPALGTAPEALEEDLRTGRFLDAAQALEYGLIDEICGDPVGRVRPLLGAPLGFGPRP